MINLLTGSMKLWQRYLLAQKAVEENRKTKPSISGLLETVRSTYQPLYLRKKWPQKMKVFEEEKIVIPKKRKPEDDIASLLAKTNTEHNNQIRALKAELKNSVQSTRQTRKFAGTKNLYLWGSHYGEGKYFLDCQ